MMSFTLECPVSSVHLLIWYVYSVTLSLRLMIQVLARVPPTTTFDPQVLHVLDGL
jgi:hypothetical protein